MKTKDKILQGASRYLLKHGQSGFTVRAIAGEAGVNQGLVHHYFGSKENLILALIDRQADEMLERVLEVHDETVGEDVRESLRKTIVSVLSQDFGRLLIEFINLAQHSPAIKEKAGEILRSRREVFAELMGIADPLDKVVMQAGFLGILLQSMVDPSIAVGDGIKRIFEILGSNKTAKADQTAAKGEI